MEKADYTYYLRIFLTDISKPLVFKVDKETSERVERNLEGRLASFCWFSTVDGREVAMNLRCVDLINFLWEPKLLDPSQGPASNVAAEEDEDETIRLHFKGRTTPCETAVDEAWRAWDLFENLTMIEVDDAPFIGFLDVDGEDLYINAKKLVYVEAPASLLARGAKEAEDQDRPVEPPEPARPVRKASRTRRR